MSERDSPAPDPETVSEDTGWTADTLTDLVDRIEREAFRRALEQRKPARRTDARNAVT